MQRERLPFLTPCHLFLLILYLALGVRLHWQTGMTKCISGRTGLTGAIVDITGQ